MSAHFAEACSNPGVTDRWTCPGCYDELGCVGEGEHVCPGCNRKVRCYLESQPVCTTELVEVNDA